MASPDDKEHRSGSVTNITAAALDRISKIARRDGRLEELISMKSGSEGQKALKQARLAAGMKVSNVWLPEPVLEQLKQKYPGPRGGIDWARVTKIALEES